MRALAIGGWVLVVLLIALSLADERPALIEDTTKRLTADAGACDAPPPMVVAPAPMMAPPDVDAPETVA